MTTPDTNPPPHEQDPYLPGEQEGIPELRFLEGPQSRRFEFGRILRIANEFLRGFRRLHFVGPCVTVFGSARFTEDNPHYQLARETSALIAKAGFTIMTGGGPERSTYFHSMYVYDQAFKFGDMGYASALGVLQFAIILALTGIVLLAGRRLVYYRGA